MGEAPLTALKSRPETPDIPVIFMTAFADMVDKVRGLSRMKKLGVIGKR